MSNIHKTIALLTIITLTSPTWAQIQTFTYQNTQRQYLLFQPTTAEYPLPIMYFLHGLGDNITRCNNEMHFDSLAERYGWLIVVPQATNVSGTTMWNAGLGGTADDAGFLLALLDTLISHNQANPDSVFFTGFSMGGFMTHRLAIEHSDRITACAPVSGLIAHPFARQHPSSPIRIMHIHGTSDNVVGWNGNSSYFGNLGISVDSITNFWAAHNHCSSTPIIDTLPDRINDGLRFIRLTYSGEADFILLKAIGGTHNWYLDTNTHDIDYFDEIHRFFTSENSPLAISQNETPNPTFTTWPNPASNSISINTTIPQHITLYNILGKPILQQALPTGTSHINIDHLPKGLYIIKSTLNQSQKTLLIKQ